MLDLGLFRVRSLVSANIAGFFSSAAMFGTLVLLPFFFQSVAGNSQAAAGLKIAPMALMFLFVAPLGGRLSGRLFIYGPRRDHSSGSGGVCTAT